MTLPYNELSKQCDKLQSIALTLNTILIIPGELLNLNNPPGIILFGTEILKKGL